MTSLLKPITLVLFLVLSAIGCAKGVQDAAKMPAGPQQKPLIATQIQVGITQQEMSRDRCHLSSRTASASGAKVSK